MTAAERKIIIKMLAMIHALAAGSFMQRWRKNIQNDCDQLAQELIDIEVKTKELPFPREEKNNVR